VKGLLPTGRCTGDFVARQLGADLRTLQRQLAAAGTSFQEIVAEVRTDLAAQYLEGSERPLANISELLGFSALSAFSRWHQKQYGQSPSERRRSAQTGAPSAREA
jgi:AraC-like DNA-binding protein